MSAQDNLNSQQFAMPMHDIMKLNSIDYPGTVADLVAHRSKNPRAYPADQQALRDDMARNGQRAPILVQGNSLTNGGDRVTHAHALGWDSMQATHRPNLSSDVNWEDDHYKYERPPGYTVHPAYANPEDWEAGHVQKLNKYGEVIGLEDPQ
jgi:hypothetical protein